MNKEDFKIPDREELTVERYTHIRVRLEELEFRPYLDMGVILFLKNILTKEMSVLETGSGASTIWFAERVKKVVTFEHSSVWYHVVMDVLEERGLKNVMVCFEEDYHLKLFPKIKEQFDIVFLDGKNLEKARTACIVVGYKNVKLEGYLIIDDSDRFTKGLEILDNLGWAKLEFEGADIYGEEKITIIYRNSKEV